MPKRLKFFTPRIKVPFRKKKDKLQKKTFIKNNESFTCKNCKANVQPHPSSSRDHCNFCLHGLHVDLNPGDRANSCHGILKPVGLKIKTKKEQIVYDCKKCKSRVYCVVAPDDDREEIMKLVGIPF